MSGLNNLYTRLDFDGGIPAEKRMIKDKLKTLKKALLYSYQAQTIILEDGRKFRCLINSNKLKPDYDGKIISIPFEDICLGKRIERIDENTGESIKEDIVYKPNNKTSKGIELINLKPGDTFEWEENGTYWIVYLQRLNEKAYFRAEIYKCEETVEIDNKQYHVYIRGPVETTIQWNQKKDINWNDLNYSLIMYIKKDDVTSNYFSRFKTIKVNEKQWEVEVVDSYAGDGILEVILKEHYENPIEEYSKKDDNDRIINENEPYIEGDNIVHPFDIKEYKLHNLKGGTWSIDNEKKAKIIGYTETAVKIEIISGKSGEFNLFYNNIDINKDTSLNIRIKSL